MVGLRDDWRARVHVTRLRVLERLRGVMSAPSAERAVMRPLQMAFCSCRYFARSSVTACACLIFSALPSPLACFRLAARLSDAQTCRVLSFLTCYGIMFPCWPRVKRERVL